MQKVYCLRSKNESWGGSFPAFKHYGETFKVVIRDGQDTLLGGWEMDFTTGLMLLLVGILAGGYGTIVGAGGGFIFVPVLLIFFQMKPAMAASTGLVIVFINAVSGVFGYARKKKINYRLGIIIGIGALPGTVTGIWLLQIYSSNSFYIIFASILVCLGIFLFIRNSPITRKRKAKALANLEDEDERFSSEKAKIDASELPIQQCGKLLPLGFLMGILSSYLGIGGGWLLVPILVYLFHVSTHNATATSIFALCLYSLFGVIFNLFLNTIDWMTVMWGGIGVAVGSQIGVISSQKLSSKVIFQMLSVLLIIIGFRMYFN